MTYLFLGLFSFYATAAFLKALRLLSMEKMHAEYWVIFVYDIAGLVTTGYFLFK